MNALAVVRGSCAIRGGSNEWVSELHASPDLQQPGVHQFTAISAASVPALWWRSTGSPRGSGGGGEDEKLGIE